MPNELQQLLSIAGLAGETYNTAFLKSLETQKRGLKEERGLTVATASFTVDIDEIEGDREECHRKLDVILDDVTRRSASAYPDASLRKYSFGLVVNGYDSAATEVEVALEQPEDESAVEYRKQLQAIIDAKPLFEKIVAERNSDLKLKAEYEQKLAKLKAEYGVE